MIRRSSYHRHELSIRLIALIFVWINVTLSGNTADTVRHQYDAGFTYQAPADWIANVWNGRIVIETDTIGAFMLIQPVFNENYLTADILLNQIPQQYPDLFPQATIGTIQVLNRQPDEQAVEITYHSKNGNSGTARALVSVEGISAMVYAIAAPTEYFAELRTGMIATLSTFRFTAINATATTVINYQTWRDPLENAFSLQIPDGWSVTGGLTRVSSVDTRAAIQVISPAEDILIQIGDSGIPPFIAPNPSLSAMGFTEGSWYSPGYGTSMLIQSYMNGTQFVAWYIETVWGEFCRNLTFEMVQDQPTIAQAYQALAVGNGIAGIRTELTAGEAIFSCTLDNMAVRGYYHAVVFGVQDYNTGSILWNVLGLNGYGAADSQEATAHSILEQMLTTFQYEASWVRMQQNITIDVSQIVTETNQVISGIIRSTYEGRQPVEDEISRAGSNARLGLTDVVDPQTGEVWRVEAGHTYYWRNGDTVSGGDIRPEINFQLLESF